MLNAGHSKKLAYLRRTQEVSIGLMADYVAADEVSLNKEDTAENTSDIMTKSLEYDLHWRHVKAMGLG